MKKLLFRNMLWKLRNNSNYSTLLFQDLIRFKEFRLDSLNNLVEPNLV